MSRDIWVVIVFYNYEGYDSPDSVWTKEADAEARAQAIRDVYGPFAGDVQVLNFVLNKIDE